MNIQSLKQIPYMGRLLATFSLTYVLGEGAGGVTDAYMMGGLVIALFLAAIPNVIILLPSKKKDYSMVETTTVNATLLRRKLDAGGSIELILSGESIDLVGE